MVKRKIKKVVVAMSGGVDSSVAAALLQKQGYQVIGAFMKFWKEKDILIAGNRCCSAESQEYARETAVRLGIPLYTFNLEKEFKSKVVDYFIKEYKEGKTPNPCVRCNKEIKFKFLIKKALGLGVDFVATGHYARNIKEGKRYKLVKARDKRKDQSYFLWTLRRSQLRRILFPIGDYTKEEVRGLARNFKLPTAERKESQEACFISSSLYEFLSKFVKTSPGPIIDINSGKILGKHKGLPFYTTGQRKDIGIGGRGPYWVTGKDIKKNILKVTSVKSDKNLNKKNLVAGEVNWTGGKEPEFPLRIKAQIRYHHLRAPAVVKRFKRGFYQVSFNRSQRAITPGQSVVFYQREGLLGGGVIRCGTEN